MSDPTKTDLAIHNHVFETGDTGRTLLLLHGTGGDEHDLLPLGRKLALGAALLSPRGNVLENGMPRFFKRYAEGVFDLEDVVFRARELARWLRSSMVHHSIDAQRLTVVGYSNGANIAAAVMLLEPGLIHSAILLRGMVTIEPPPSHPVPTRVLLLTGEQDAFIPLDNAKRLAMLLRSRGMNVDQHIFPTGHQLVQADLAISMRWIAGLP